MNPKKQEAGSVSSIGALGKGVIYGLAFFVPGILLLGRWDDLMRIVNGISDMPVIHRISRDFQTGIEVAGDLFLKSSFRFYTSDSTFIFAEHKVPDSLVWHRDSIEKKLTEKFGRRKMKNARRFLDYIEQYQSLATSEMFHSRIPASIILAQGILESKAGDSFLAKVAKNHFGIKCRKRRDYKSDGVIDDSDFYHHKLAYGCVQRADDHEWDRFEMYDSDALSFRHHAWLLTSSGRYNWMLDKYLTGENYRVSGKWFKREVVPYYAAWAIGLKEGGYATSRRYAQKLALIIETYELWRFDYSVLISAS